MNDLAGLELFRVAKSDVSGAVYGNVGSSSYATAEASPASCSTWM